MDVCVCVYEIDGMFNSELKDCTNHMVKWAISGQEMLVFLHEVNDGYTIHMWNASV